MLKKCKKPVTFYGFSTNADFIKMRDNLMELVRTKREDPEISNILLKIGWLYDQWALIASKKQRNVYQDESAKFFRFALKKGAQKWVVFNGLGTVELHKGNYKKALVYYKKMHNIHRSSKSYNALVNAYRQLAKFTLSKKNYRQALSLAENSVEKS